MRLVITGIALAMIGSASSGTADPATCRLIAEDATRLACYDAAFRTTPISAPPTSQGDFAKEAAPQTIPSVSQTAAPVSRAASSIPPATPSPSPPVPAVSPDALFGKPDAANSEVLRNVYGVPHVEAIESTLAEVHKAANGRYVLALANSQVWVQTDDTVLPLVVGTTIRIRHGAMGSFLLGIGSTKKTMRVKRTD